MMSESALCASNCSSAAVEGAPPPSLGEPERPHGRATVTTPARTATQSKERRDDLLRRRAEVVDVLAETILDELFGVPRGPVGPTKRCSQEPTDG